MSIKTFKVPISAGGFTPLQVRGNFVALVAPTGLTITVKTKTGEFELKAGESQSDMIEIFEEIELHNDTAADVVANVKVGFGRYTTSNISGALVLAPNVAFAHKPMITITGAVQSVAANLVRAKITLQAAAGNTGKVWVGGVLNEGFPLEANDTIDLPVTSAFNVLGTVAGDLVYLGEIL